MAEKMDSLGRLRSMIDGTYESPPPPPFDVQSSPLFAGLGRVTIEGLTSVELAPGLELRPSFAHVFAAPMVALAPPPTPKAPHPGPWHALEGGGDAESIHVELSLAEGARPFDLSRMATIRFVAAAFRLVSSQPVSMPLLCNVPLAEAKEPGRKVRVWKLERPLAISGQPVKLTEGFGHSLRAFLPDVQVLGADNDLARAFSLADGMWWLPTLEAQMTTIWAAIEMLMRPGRRDTTKELGRAIRAYASFDRSSGDRLYQDVTRLYGRRSSYAHAGAQLTPGDIRDSYMILRTILLRAFQERKRPPMPPDIVQLW